ncbi:MAG TPA: asparaginase domain-containing protein [Candidatus Saccharimonadales bacterium]|nr:asparaginase domain-containing protein [Candidatus Saccharimonadales bacterium]
MARQHIHIILTGGTIDSEWNPSKDTATTASESVIPDYFEKLKPDFDLTFETALMKDSRELTGDDIRAICAAVDGAPSERILITHGTYTMPDTARYLEQNMKSGKSVVLTGSIIPLKGYDMSDAPFNLGFAMAQLLNMQPGVKIVLQGHVFSPQDVGKNLAEGRFFSLEELGKS